MKIFLFPRRSETYPESACEMEAMALPRPSINPSMAMFPPERSMTYFGQIGYIMSEPKSFRKEASENTVRNLLLFSFALSFIVVPVFLEIDCAFKCCRFRLIVLKWH